LPPLPYPADSLEPVIDAETVILHHDRHFKKYVDDLNSQLCLTPPLQSWTLEELLTRALPLSGSQRQLVLTAAGGVYNHGLYFRSMVPGLPKGPGKQLSAAICRNFGDMESLQKQFVRYALSLVGSGWIWLCTDPSGHLRILCTGNQVTALPTGLCPLFLMDVWEHAYYLKYQNERQRYAESWFRVLNWEEAEKNYCRFVAR
jgi:Fe-Mn family superoxide dismutase